MFAAYDFSGVVSVAAIVSALAVNLSPEGSPVTAADGRLSPPTASVIGSISAPVSYSGATSAETVALSSLTGMNRA